MDIDGDDYIIAKPWDLLTKDVNELQNIIEEKRGNLKKLVVDKASKRQQAEHAELEDMKGCGKGTSAGNLEKNIFLYIIVFPFC